MSDSEERRHPLTGRRLSMDFEPKNVTNLEILRNNQLKKFNNLRETVRRLRFVPIDPAGSYISTSFKSFDGGRFNLNFDPFEFDIVRVADSNGNTKMNFAAPAGDLRDDAGELGAMLRDLDTDPIIQNFLSMVGERSLQDITEILTARETLMEIAEFACIFNAIMQAPDDSRTLILRDGLLRTKKIRAELIPKLKGILLQKSHNVRLAGVAKSSRVISLLRAALACERVFPSGQIGYVRIPLEIENMAYRWGGGKHLRTGSAVTLEYAFGTLYVAKLSRQRDLLVTVEIPGDAEEGAIYSDDVTAEIMGHLAKDSAHSYPVIGYPQTLMRAHEFAASMGMPASILRDRIMADMIKDADPGLAGYMQNFDIMNATTIHKGTLGGRA